jgi:DNA repair exonuclease SbcCD nuclease subunit
MTDFTLADGRRVHLIGDPHLGKKFETGVPAHRRGERELSQAAHFVAELDTDADIIVQVGDLFDNPNVSREVVLSAACAALAAAERNPDVLFFHMAGNHDQPRNLGTVGAWPLFKKMIESRHENLFAVDRPTCAEGIALFPWEWDRTAAEQVADLEGCRYEVAVGHWDLSIFDGKDDHLVPVAALRGVPIYSGHYHKPGAYTVADVEVICTGSMEPYAHGEGDMYVTVTRAEALERDDLHDKVVRVILAPGEETPEIDCLALTHVRSRDDADEEDTVSLDDFDFHRIVRERIQDRDPQVRDFIEERMSLEPEKQRGGSDQAT